MIEVFGILIVIFIVLMFATAALTGFGYILLGAYAVICTALRAIGIGK